MVTYREDWKGAGEAVFFIYIIFIIIILLIIRVIKLKF
jgi:hypothetical protein